MTLQDFERDPEFRRRAAVLEPILRAGILLDRDINLGDVARELQVPLDIAGIWCAMIMTSMGKPFKLRVTGLPQ